MAVLRLKVAFEQLPVARWGSLFHVLVLERPDIRLEWLSVPFPTRDRSPLQGADVGLFTEPADDPELRTLTIGVSRMVVMMAAGHRLARHHHELRTADVLAEPFPDGADLHPGWRAFWTLDAYRGAPPPTSSPVTNVEQGLDLVAAGGAIATFPESLADGLPHPGVIAVPLVDGPAITTRLVWRAGEQNPAVHTLVDLARDMFGGDGASRIGDQAAGRSAR
jgi:DNA-binding transcriptional LysR family regulator